jgi:hypothetical protein
MEQPKPPDPSRRKNPLKNKKARKRGPLVGLNSELVFKHALAVFITRPQADYQIGAPRKNNQLG